MKVKGWVEPRKGEQRGVAGRAEMKAWRCKGGTSERPGMAVPLDAQLGEGSKY